MVKARDYKTTVLDRGVNRCIMCGVQVLSAGQIVLEQMTSVYYKRTSILFFVLFHKYIVDIAI